VFVVDALGFFELVFEDDDAAGGFDRGAVVDEFPGAGGDAQLVAGVAAVAARGAQRGDQAGVAEGAEEALGGARSSAARPIVYAGGVVVIVESAERVVCCHCTSSWNASRSPGVVRHQGPEGTAHDLPTRELGRVNTTTSLPTLQGLAGHSAPNSNPSTSRPPLRQLEQTPKPTRRQRG
jgi:hypothetical protein